MRADATKHPSTEMAERAQRALRVLEQLLPEDGAGSLVRLHSDREPALLVDLPREALSHLLEILEQMAVGNAVAVVPVHTELTTHQAADLLGISRPTLIGLLDEGEIPFRMVGTHRRIRFTDLMAYRQQEKVLRDEALAELTRQAEDLDLGY